MITAEETVDWPMTNFIKFPKLSYKNRTKKSNQLQGRHFNRWQKVSERHRWHCLNVIATKFKLVVYWVGKSFLKCWFLKWIWWQSKDCVRKSWSCPLQCAMRTLYAWFNCNSQSQGLQTSAHGQFCSGIVMEWNRSKFLANCFVRFTRVLWNYMW